MAPSLQELIDFLLNEVALCGYQGATLSEVIQAIETFYRTTSQDDSARRQNVDDRFKAKVWLWLTRNPEVSVGKDAEWNHLGLDDVQKLNRRGSVSSQINDAGQASEEQTSSPIRIFVSKERSWYAITGHEPDDTKVPASEFALLSIIASRKSNGIPQTELVRLSGQDKRSVPKRTDALQRKGYIQKRPVQVKAARTSLCTLCKFLNSPSASGDDRNTQNNAPAADTIDFQTFTSNIFDILRSHNGIVARNDLKRLLGFDDPWRWRILSRALRKLERIGVTKRVKAASQYEKYHPCVRLEREPTPRDMELFNEFGNQSFAVGDDDQLGLDEEMELDTDPKKAPGADPDAAETAEQRIIDVGRIVPSWNPDRNIHNQVFDIVNNAGTEGITNIGINRACFGTFYRRPTENLIHRLVDCWQISQPPHLRHLAIVRDSAIERTVIYYIHYSAKNFAKLADAEVLTWQAVEFPSEKAKSSNVDVPSVDAAVQLDEYGFRPQIPRGLVKNGRISLFEGLVLCKPTDYSVTSSDPALCRYPDGSTGVVPGHIKSQGGDFPGEEIQDEAVQGVVDQFITPVRPKRGRPRSTTTKSTGTKGRKHSAPLETPGRQSTEPNEEDITIFEEDNNTVLQTSTRSTKAKDKFKLLPRKERFEAMGMDETWTEYSALTMAKPTPGVYVTARGKRRPAGKKQGRPKQSRIAVFRLPGLHSLPWFVKENDDSDDQAVEGAEEVAPQPLGNSERTPSDPRRAKRGRPALDSDSLDPFVASIDPDTPSETPRKRARLQQTPSEGGIDHVDQKSPEPFAPESEPPAPVVGTLPKRSSGYQESEETATPKRRRIEPLKSKSPADKVYASQRVATTPPPQPMAPPQRGPTPSAKASTRKSGPVARGGSINILRRKIVMEVVETAGGAYPAGNEIWYPFTTKWKQANRKEKPDMRTIKNSIKHLIDSGKLRQITFTGKDSDGVMATKTLLATPEISPDDPLVKEMQAKMLASKRADQKTTYSSEIDLDPEVTRSTGRTGVHKYTLPLVTGAKVQLQTKPASVQAEEKRRERKLQKELMRRLEREHEAAHPGVRRLMKIQRNAYDPLQNLQESIFQPTMVVKPGQRQKAERLVKKISTIGWYAMSMNPQQRYHPGTGTFGTFGTFAPETAPIEPGVFQQFNAIAKKNPVTNDGASINDLAELARQSQGGQQVSPQDFNSINDRISNWELGHEEMFHEILANQPFIEQGVYDSSFHAAPIDGSIRFAIDRPSQRAQTAKSPMMTRKRGARLQLNEAARTMANALRDQNSAPPALEPQSQPAQQGKIGRRKRNLRPLSDSLTRKIMMALVAVRSLAGGSEGRILDWDLVRLAFPKFDAEFVRQSANRIISKTRLEIIKMQRDFQERFLEAYAEGKVPPIDYNHLDQYDWPRVVEWASAELDVSASDKVPSLPATRDQFDSIFEIREEPIVLAQELYKTSTGSTVAYKRDLMARTPFAVQLNGRTATKRESQRKELAQLDVTKTWVRANIITPNEIYDSVAARETLAPFGEKLLSDATQLLLNETVISAGNRGRVTPGRNYETHDFFRHQLDRKRAIDREQLQRAAEFKINTLDVHLQKQGSFDLDYHATDGDILALVNLYANGRIELRPRNPPCNKFGLLDGGYLTRQMDKTQLRFDVEIRALPSYVYGNPVKKRIAEVPPPSAPPSKDPILPRKIPLWFAIHHGYGQLLPDYWERALASVLGCVDTRHGVDAEDISKMLRPTLGAWEIELLLGWLAEVGLADRHEGKQVNWTLREWWWMVLG